MLHQPSVQIADCYRHAAEASERAKSAPDLATKQDFLDIERHWISLARSYELAERASNFTSEVERRFPTSRRNG